jgi:hypothetical protein
MLTPISWLVKRHVSAYLTIMNVEQRVKKWMKDQGLSYARAGKLLGITHTSLFYGLQRGTFSRLTVAKLLTLVPGLAWDDFLLPAERREIAKLRKSQAA